MKLIALTQRVELQGTERRDCLDQRWTHLAFHAGYQTLPLSNADPAPEKTLERMKVEGILLTGGNDLSAVLERKSMAPERDLLEEKILRYAQHERLPVVGVCRGMQMLVHFTGGRITPLDGHTSGRHAVEFSGHSNLFASHPDVNTAHRFGVRDRSALPLDWEVLATAHDGSIEAIQHTQLPWWGLMWHPEREGDFEPGLALLQHLFGERK